MLLSDAQTSGGLLMAFAPEDARRALEGRLQAAVVGEVLAGPAGAIFVR